jgi:hypothetical protein
VIANTNYEAEVGERRQEHQSMAGGEERWQQQCEPRRTAATKGCLTGRTPVRTEKWPHAPTTSDQGTGSVGPCLIDRFSFRLYLFDV